MTKEGVASEPAAGSGAARRLDFAMLRDAAKQLGAQSLKDGTWFRELVRGHAKKHQTMVTTTSWDEVYPGLDVEARADKHIQRVAMKASAAGAFASIGASTGELLSLLTEGLAAPIGVPAAMLSMGLEAAYTALLQIDLACDLASIYGVPYNPDDLGELATLFAVALEIDIKKSAKGKGEGGEKGEGGKDEEEKHAGITERLIDLEEGEVATRIGRKLIEESVMRNIIPLVGVAISARWNYVATRLLGRKAKKYVRYRRAIKMAFSKLDTKAILDPMVLVEGAWLLSTSDGETTHEELMGIALLVDALSGAVPLDMEKARVDDEEDWLRRLGESPPECFGAILDSLYLIAGTDRELQMPERRMLKRIGSAMKREIDFGRIEQICRHLADGEGLPANFAAHAPLETAG